MGSIVITGVILQGLLYGLMVLGVYISFRVLNFPDLTVDGSFTLGAGTAAILIASGVDPILATLIAPVAGWLAGMVTGVLHSYFGITPLLAGILTMTGLYSVNLRVMGVPNLPLMRKGVLFDLLPAPGGSQQAVQILFSIFIVLLIIYILYWFLNTEYGQALRGTGDNEAMMRSVGVDTNRMKVIGLALCNSLVAFSGSMIAQYQRFADISMGIGMIIAGLASVIIGEVLLGVKSIQGKLCAVVIGSIVYRFVIALVLEIDFIRVTDLKLFTALLVIIALISPRLKQGYTRRTAIKKANEAQR